MHNNALALFAIKFSSTKKKVLFRIGGGGGHQLEGISPSPYQSLVVLSSVP